MRRLNRIIFICEQKKSEKKRCASLVFVPEEEQVYIRQKCGYNTAAIIYDFFNFKYDAALNADRMAD